MTNEYAFGQLAKAFITATTHEDPEVRGRADARARRWAQAMQWMAQGRVLVGSRTPVEGLPEWVTLEVLRGGFASGRAAAATPVAADEVAWAGRLGLPADRRALFGHFLTDAGLAELDQLLDSRAYRVDVPEDAALLTMAWLLRSADRIGALEILDAIAPLAGQLRFTPKRADPPTSPPDVVYRISAGEAATVLGTRRPNLQVEKQREALAVWNPFGDRVLALWLAKYVAGRITIDGDPAWEVKARNLCAEYEYLAATHTRCAKHRNPKQNLAILIDGLRKVSTGQPLSPRDRGLIRTAIDAAVRKRGVPGSVEHARLRETQRATAGSPPHWQLAAIAGKRLATLDPDDGIAHPEYLAGDVTADEAVASGLPEGAAMPAVVSRLLARARSAPIETLLADGVVPSAEVLAALVPAISSAVVATGFPDAALAQLMAANYRAFRRRRSLLLLDLERQVQLTELPWVRAAWPHSTQTADEAMAVARRVAALALDHFPSTILPNPLVRELWQLLDATDHAVPLVEELAADIFMGSFSDKFRRAAQTAARVIAGTAYARYYGIDTEQLLGLVEPPPPAARAWWRRGNPAKDVVTFGDLCTARAGWSPTHRSVAANGAVVEQAQILTTHNLAALVTIGVRPARPWTELAREAIGRTSALLHLAARQDRPYATIKDAAYAWRQGIFFLSVADPADARAVLDDPSVAAREPQVVTELMTGLRAAVDGRPIGDHVPFLGWAVGRHWVLDALRPPVDS